MQKNENNIIIYQDEDGVTKVSVKFSDEDIWLTQNQIAEIYKTTKQNISLHINNIYKDKEGNILIVGHKDSTGMISAYFEGFKVETIYDDYLKLACENCGFKRFEV